jgi:hypothetical protein
MARRPWKKFVPEFAKNMSGPVTVGTLTLFGFAAAATAIALPWALAAGAGVFLVNGLRAIPARFKDPSELLDARLDLRDLAQIDPPVFKVGLVGISSVGKTNLHDRIGNRSSAQERTSKLYASIFAASSKKLRFVAVLDGAGNEFHQQFAVAARADFLIVVLDSNQSDSEKTLDEMRIQKHEDFVDQLRSYLQQNPHSVKHFEILLNKRDLWKDEPFATRLRTWLQQQTEKLKIAFPNQFVQSRAFSNRIDTDYPQLFSKIISTADADNFDKTTRP